MRRLLILLLLLATPAAAQGADRISTAGQRFVDSRGGEWLLRGGNVIAKPTGLPDVSAHDIDVMRELGWTTVRLGTGWRFLEPTESGYDPAYADKFAAIARRLTDAGFRVIVDMHQDLWGPPVGNGAPQWSAPAQCEQTHIPLSQYAGAWAADYFSPRTICAFTRFWADTALQDHLIAAYRMIATRLAGDPGVVGIDLFNEPFNGALAPGVFETAGLFPFYERAAAAIHAIAPQLIVFEEPSVSKTVFMAGVPQTPAADGNRAWAPHIYGPWDFNSSGPQRRDEMIEVSMRASAQEAAAGERPLWFGEFGIFNGAEGAEQSMTRIYDLADELHAGTALWELDDPGYGPLRPDGSLIQPRARTVARGYPLRVGGTLDTVRFEDGTSRLTVSWTQSAAGGETILVLPSLRYPGALSITAGADVDVVAHEDGRLVLQAAPGSREISLAPAA